MEMGDNNSSMLCDTAFSLSNNFQLRLMTCIHIVVAVTGLLLFAILFRIEGKFLAFHTNARILLFSHHIWVLLQCITNFFSEVYSLWSSSVKYEDSCDYLITATESFLIRGPVWFTMYGQVWALAAMAVERFVATIKYKDYEAKQTFLAIVLVPAQVRLT
jgi:hypothetical protein